MLELKYPIVIKPNKKQYIRWYGAAMLIGMFGQVFLENVILSAIWVMFTLYYFFYIGICHNYVLITPRYFQVSPMFNFWSWRPRTFLWSDYSLVFDDVINMNVVQIVERHEKMKSEISHIIIPNVAYLNRQAINYKQFLAILKQANQQQFPIYLPQDTASQWEHLKRHLNYPHIPKGKD